MARKTGWLTSLALVMGCAGGDPTQVLTGNVGSTEDAIAVRAVSGTDVVAATPVRSDGSFSLAIPSGSYRLEMLTSKGVRPVVTTSDGLLVELAFQVCAPTAPYNLGTMGAPGDGLSNGSSCNGGSGSTGNGSGDGSGNGSDNGGNGSDNGSGWGGGSNGGGSGGGGSGSDCGSGGGGGSDNGWGSGGGSGEGGGSGNGGGSGSGGGGSGCDANGSDCQPPPFCGPDANGSDGSDCVPPNGSGGGSAWAPPPPPCADPDDPSTCQDPCMNDPASCGCGSGDPVCWPAPGSNGGSCSDGLLPSHPPGNFGCAESGGR